MVGVAPGILGDPGGVAGWESSQIKMLKRGREDYEWYRE